MIKAFSVEHVNRAEYQVHHNSFVKIEIKMKRVFLSPIFDPVIQVKSIPATIAEIKLLILDDKSM